MMQEEQQMKCQDIEAVITFFKYNIHTGVCLKSFENVLCHFEPNIYWLLITAIQKKLYFYWEPQERQCMCAYSIVCLE